MSDAAREESVTVLATARPAAARRRSRRSSAGWIFVGPFFVVFALVFVAPVVYSLWLSAFREQLIGGNHFVGLANYERVVGDPAFWAGVGRVGLTLVVQVPIMLALALALALAIDSGRLWLPSFFRIAIFLPYAVPAVVASLLWGFMYGNRFGLVASISEQAKVSLPDPLAPDYILASIGNIVTWEFVGYNMLIFYAALRVIPSSLYEAAAIDGASRFRIMTSIKLPALRGTMAVATIFSIIGTFQLFNEPSILQKLAPNAITSSFTPNLYAFSTSFSAQDYNYSATIAIVMGLVTMAVAYVVQLRGMREGS